MNGGTMQGGIMPSSLCVPFWAIPTASQETQGEGFFLCDFGGVANRAS